MRPASPTSALVPPAAPVAWGPLSAVGDDHGPPLQVGPVADAHGGEVAVHVEMHDPHLVAWGRGRRGGGGGGGGGRGIMVCLVPWRLGKEGGEESSNMLLPRTWHRGNRKEKCVEQEGK